MRKAFDHYTTASITTLLTQELLHYVSISGVILEPCAGEGFMAQSLTPFAKTLYTNDIQQKFQTDFSCDARDPDAVCYHCQPHPDWIVTNPPYKDAFAILQASFASAKRGVAFLLRQTFDEPTKARKIWLQNHADCLRFRIPISPRPNWREGEFNLKTGRAFSNDSTTNTWFVWRKDWSWKRLQLSSPFGYIVDWKETTQLSF